MIPKWYKVLTDYMDEVSKVGQFVRTGQGSGFAEPLQYLQSLPVEFVVIGGLAASHFAPARLTVDIDILVRSEGDVQQLKQLTVGTVKWNRPHTFTYGQVEVEVLSPEFVQLPSQVVDYVFNNKVTGPGGYDTPNAEGVILLKSLVLREVDKQDIQSIIKSQGRQLDLDTVMSLTTEEGRAFITESLQKLKPFLDDEAIQ